MEMFATTCVWEARYGRLTLYDKMQGATNVRSCIAMVFGLKKKNVRVVSAYVGGADGVGLRIDTANAFCAVMASLALERSVRVCLSRRETFTIRLPARHAARHRPVLRQPGPDAIGDA